MSKDILKKNKKSIFCVSSNIDKRQCIRYTVKE